MNTDSYNMLKTAATLIYLYIVLVVSLQYLRIMISVDQMYCLHLHEQWFINDVIDRCYIDIYILTFIVVMICGWCHSKFWSTLRFATIHFIFTVVVLFWTVLPSYSILEHIPYSVTLVVWVVFRGYNSSTTSRDFLQFHTWDTSLS